MYGEGVIPQSVQPVNTPNDKLNTLDINSVYAGNVPQANTFVDPLDAFARSRPKPSMDTMAQADTFDWDKSKTDRYTNSDYYGALGADPMLNNETRYGAVQTWGDTWGNALGGSWKLASQTFVEGWKGWGNMANALFNWNSEDSFSERLMGTPEELMAQNQAQEAIFNKYAIFSTPESENSIFNRQFVGNLVQQAGFALGAGAQFAMESLLTAGIANALKPFTAAKTLGAVATFTDLAANAQKGSAIARDFIKTEGIAEKIWEGTRKFIPMAGEIAGSGRDAIKAYRNGEGLLQSGMIGLGGVKRALSEFNMAATEARFEAAGTYGNLYGNLYDQYTELNGKAPEGEELIRLQDMATKAAWDNFRVNTGILMVANRVQFDNLLTKFSNSRSTLKNLTENTTSDLFSVTAKQGEKKVTEVFEKGRFGKLGAYGEINRSLGRKAANIEAFKTIMGGLTKWEVSEGAQEILQETSNTALTDYYTDLYNGKAGDSGDYVENALAEQASMQGLKTFLMGAVTGRLISPLSYTATKSMEGISTTREQRADKRAWVAEQKDIINAGYQNLSTVLNEAVANTKVGNRAAKTMTKAVQDNSRYTYNNDKETALAKMVSAAIKTNMLPSVLDTLRDYGQYFSEEEWKQAYGDLGKEKVQEYTNKVATKIEDFANRWNELKDKFGDLVIPASVPKDSQEFKQLQQRKWVLDSMIETLATADYRQQEAITRATELMNQVSAVPNIGSSSNRAFSVLRDDVATRGEIGVLTQEIKGLEQNTQMTAADREYLKDKKAQLKALQQWDERESDRKTNHNQKVFEDYINATNKVSKNTALVNKSDVNDVFSKFNDYRKLNNRHREMLNAFNTLVDPLNFDAWIVQTEKAATEARDNLRAQHEQELEKQTGEPTPVPTPTDTDLVSTAGLDDDFLSGGSSDFEETPDVGDIVTESGVVEQPAVQYIEFDGQQLRPGQRLWKPDGTYDRAVKLLPTGVLSLGKNRSITTLANHSLLGPQIQFNGQVLNIDQKVIAPDNREFWINGLTGGKLKLRNDMTNTTSEVTSLDGYTYDSTPLPTGKRTFEGINDIGYVYPHRAPGETPEEAQVRFSEFLAGVDIEEFRKGVTIKVTPNDKYKGEFRPNAENPQLSNASGPLTVQLIYNGQPIGYLTQPEMATLLTPKGEVLSTGNITQEDFNQVYKVTGMSQQEAYNQFIAKKQSAEALKDYLMTELGDKQELTLDNKRTQELLGISVSGGGFNWSTESGNDRTPLNELSESTAKVGNKRYTLVVDRLQADSESGPLPWNTPKYRGQGDSIITDAETKVDRQKLDQLWQSVKDKADNLNRYVAVITLDNGNTKVVELAPQQMSVVNLQEAIQGIHDQIAITQQNNIAADGSIITNDYNDEFNSQLSSELFIAPGKGYIYPEVSPDGKMRIHYYLYTAKDQPAIRVNAYDNDNKFQNVKTPEQLAQFITDLLVEQQPEVLSIMLPTGQKQFTVENFRQGFGSDPDIGTVRVMEAKVDKEIATKNWKLNYEYKGPKLTGPTTQRVSAPKKAITPTGTKVETPKVVKLTGTDKQKRNDILKAIREGVQTRVTLTDGSVYAVRNEVSGYSDRDDSIIGYKNGESVEFPVLSVVKVEQISPDTEEVMGVIYNSVLTAQNQPGSALPDAAQMDLLMQAMQQMRLDIERENQLSNDSSVVDERIRKVTDQQFDEVSVEQVDQFKVWATSTLPEFITVSDIQQLEKNLKGSGVTVGTFITLMDRVNNTVTGGQISVAGRYGYHEAFHGVFRLLLNNNQIDKLLAFAKQEAKPTTQKLQEFQKLHPDYQKMSGKALEERYLEEYMADKFQAWIENKKTQTSPTIKGFFAKLWEWIKGIFGANTPGELEALYSRIDQGGFRNSNIKPNRFNTYTEPVYKLIEIGSQVTTDEDGNKIRISKYMSPEKSSRIVLDIVSLYQKEADKLQSYNKGQLLDQLLDKYRDHYNPETPANVQFLLSLRPDQMAGTLRTMYDYNRVYTQADSRQSIKEAVNKHLQMLGYRTELESDALEEMEENLGGRGMADQLAEKESFGGFDSLSRDVKRYISSFSTNGKDEVGREYFDQAKLEPIPQALSISKVYTGMLKALVGTTDKVKLLDKIEQLSESEGDTAAFARLFLADVGLRRLEDGNWSSPTDPNRIQQVLNAFNQFHPSYEHMLRDMNGNIIWSVVDARNMVKLQIGVWLDGYLSKYLNPRGAITDAKYLAEFNSGPRATLGVLQGYLKKGKITVGQSQEVSKDLASELGISITPEYIRYSVAKASEKPTKLQQKLLDNYPDVYGMSVEDIGWLSKTFTDNLFKGYDNSDEEGGALGRLRNIASGNALFDETIDTTSHKNAKKNTVQSYQQPTFHLVMGEKLKDLDYVKQLGQTPFLAGHPLLNKIEKGVQLEFFRADGLRTAPTNEQDGEVVEARGHESAKREGVTYGDMVPQEFLMYNINQYSRFSKSGKDYMVPSLIRVLEASNTGDFARMPVIKSVIRVDDKLQMTSEAIDTQFDIVQREFNRIKQVYKENADRERGLKVEVLENYHSQRDKKTGEIIPGRGQEFFNAKLMLGDKGVAIEKQLWNAWNDGGIEAVNKIKLNKKEVTEQITTYRLQQAAEFVELLRSQEFINYSDKKGYTNLKMGKFTEDGIKSGKVEDVNANTALNLVADDLEHNLYQIYINDVFNTTLLNQVLNGDEATGLKDAIDAVKRAKGANGGGATLTAPFAAPELGIPQPFTTTQGIIIQDPKYRKRDGTGIADKADGQVWASSYAYRHILYGLGKLTPKIAAILDKIDSGKPVSNADIFNSGGLVDSNGMFLPIKLAYYDGPRMVKTSVALVTREMTSYKKAGKWITLPGRADLHNILETLERQEKKNKVPAFAGPQSAFKKERRNVLPQVADNQGNLLATDDNFSAYSTDFWRLQLENPSNKKEITDPTQLKQIVTAGQDMNSEVDGKSVKEWIDQYLADSAQRVTNSYTQARGELFDITELTSELQKSIETGNITPKLAEFQDRAVENLQATGADSQTIEFFRTKDGMPLYDLNGPHTLTKYTQLFLSYFTKGVMNEKIPGHSLILMSNYGMKVIRKALAGPDGKVRLNSQGVPMDHEIIPMSEVRKNPELYESARTWDDPSDTGDRTWSNIQPGDLLIDDLRHDMDKLDAQGNPTGLKYAEIMTAPHYKEYAGMDPRELGELAYGFDTRIPTQDKSSFSTDRIVDWLPAYLGSTAVVSQERIEISGADFDVDKIYLQVPDTYVDADGVRTVYANNSFGEYINYQLQHNRQFKKLVKELRTNPYTGVDVDNYKGSTMSDLLEDWLYKEDDMYLYQTALKELGLPSTKQEFENSGIVNNGILNNQILAAKQALFTNPHTLEQGAYTTVDIKPLQDLADQLAEQFEDTEFGNRLREAPTETNDMLGKTAAFRNNKVGSRGIGPIANAMLVQALLSTAGVKFRKTYKVEKGKKLEDKPVWVMELDGQVYDGYDRQQDIRGGRIASTISMLVSMMVDNAKERLAARFGLNMESLGMVANLVSQGMPFDNAVLFINQPIIQQYFREAEVNSGALTLSGKGKDDILGTMFDMLEKAIGNLTEEQREEIEKFDNNLTSEMLTQNIKSGGSNPYLQMKVLEEFRGLRNQSQYFNDLAQIVKIVKGLGSSFEDVYKMMEKEQKLGLNAPQKEFEQLPVPFDIRELMNSTNPIMSTYRSIRDQVMSLSKSMFVEQLPVFKRIEDVVRANTYVGQSDSLRFNEELKRNLVSYLAIKGYKQMLLSKGRGNRLASIDNSLIYNTSADRKSVLDNLQHIKQVIPGNYLTQFFLNPVDMENDNNRTFMDKVEANTWSKLSEVQTEKLLDSFMEIYQNPDTRTDAWALFHYLLVKDGGMFKHNSFISFVPNQMFKDLMDSLTAGRELMSTDNYDDQEYTEVFGAPVTELYNEFVKFYLQHYDSGYYIPKLSGTFDEEVEEVEGFKPQSVVMGIDTIEVDLFKGIRELKNFDTGTEIIQVKTTGKFSDEEIAKLNINRQMLGKKGFKTVDKQVQFPLVVKQEHRDELTGYRSYTYYRLVSVGKQQGDLQNMINPGESTAQGIKARYEKFDLKGARGTFRLSEMNGVLPTNAELYKQRETQDNTGGYGFISDDILDNIADIESAVQAFPDNFQEIDYKLHQMGIDMKVENGSEFKFSGGKYNELSDKQKKSIKTPQDLLNVLAPVNTSIDMQAIADQYEDYIDDEVQDDVDNSSDILGEFNLPDDDVLDDIDYDAGITDEELAERALLRGFTVDNNNPLNDECS